ncbi:hypothetical protein E2562_022280 [Oryza meyeriana var. granulata]|uniref:poly(A)-specific ribonuclease n=1 Tax=Oryza meyeriana var. granulata TaxID=110450 RepID=A0A6G1D664_9ORYZ|nr:hypothetical protein E2562_022280 [Oryza meyeriana var. granulata]
MQTGVAAVGSDGDGEQFAPVISSSSTLFSYSPPGTARYAALASSQQVSTTKPELETEGELKTLPAPVALPFRALTTMARSPGIVKVRSVWAHNLEKEVELINSLLSSFRFAAVDTEFPGTVHRPSVPAYTLTAKDKYALMRANVDELHLVQLGLTVFDADGRLPDLGTRGAVQFVWEFNFREFDLRSHRHAPESIEFLRSKGVDFDRTRQDGVDAAAFGTRLRKWLRGGLGRAGLVTFSGAYDLAYLVKMVYGGSYRLPGNAAVFERVVKAAVGKTLYDVKEIARHCPSDLRGGLECVAGKLDVRRAVGDAHQAGSDSLLTCQMFMRMRERYFDQDERTTVAGIRPC